MPSPPDRDDGPKDLPKDITPQSDNPFIKFRQFADTQIGSILQGIIGLPSAFTRKPSANAQWADFDVDLWRRDELQARQKALKESEGRSRQDESDDAPLRRQSSGEKKDTAGLYIPKNVPKGQEIPLYSPVTKALFSHLLPHTNGEWSSVTPFSWAPEYRMEYLPFKLRIEQEPVDEMEAIQYMAYNELEGGSTFRSEYSLLPYILFSPYSPIKLQLEASKHAERCELKTKYDSRSKIEYFPFEAAFEDLIRTTQKSHGYQSFTYSTPFSIARLFSFGGGIPRSIASAAWIHHLYSDNLLQQSEVVKIPGLADMIPFSSRKQSSASEESSGEERTELDMYERFLRWASTPSSVAGALGALDSLCADTEGFLEKQVKSLESLEGRRAVKELVESGLRGSEFGKEIQKLVDFLEEKQDRSRSESQTTSSSNRDAIAQEKSTKAAGDPDKVVSTATTTSRTTNNDGSVDTSVTVWKQYADGRTSTTTTTHTEEPAYDENDNPIPTREPNKSVQTESENVERRTEKEGWFWK